MSASDIHTACKAGEMDRVKALVATGVSVNHKDNNDESPLYHAVEGKHIDTVRFLLEKGADPNSANGKEKRSPLIEAADHGYTDGAACLLDHGALVNQGDTDRFTPLWYAACEDQTETAEHLLGRGAHINHTDNSGGTPLHIACGSGNYNTAALLLHHGADADTCDDAGNSPLHFAVLYYSWNSIVQLLLQHGVRVVKDDSGETPLDVARRKMKELNPEDSKNTEEFAGYKTIISLLENYPALQESEDYTEGKVQMKTQGSSAESDKLIHKSEDVSDTEGKLCKKPQGSAAQSDKIIYPDVTYQAEKEKGDSCIIDPDIVENVLANERMKEQEKEVKRLFEGTEADDYLKEAYKQISNIGKEMKEPEATDDFLSDKHMLKLAKEMDGDWMMVGGFLGIKLSQIKQLETEYKTQPKYAAWNMLVGWRDSTEGSMRDKIQALKAALVDVEREDIADML